MLSSLAAADPCEMTINWGSVPDWIAGLMTGAAFLLAVVVWQRDLAERKRERHDAEASAARRVIAIPTASDPLVRPDGREVVDELLVHIHNYNPDAVLDVVVTVVGLERKLPVRRTSVLAPNATDVHQWSDIGHLELFHPGDYFVNQIYVPEVTFTADGLRWRRRGTQMPERVLDRTPDRLTLWRWLQKAMPTRRRHDASEPDG